MNNNLIARHAFIRAGIQRDALAGRRTPQHVLQELQTIEAQAQASLTPTELQQAQAASQSMQAQYLKQHDLQMGHREALDNAYHQDRLTQELTGYTRDQLEAAKVGQPVPKKGAAFKPKHAKQQIQEMAARAGLGRNIPYEKISAAADRLEEMRNAGRSDAQQLEQLKKSFGDKAPVAKEFLGGLVDSGAAIAIELIGDSATPDHYVRPDQRRAQLADAMAKTAARDGDTMRALIDNGNSTRDYYSKYHDPDTLEGDAKRHLDVAEAFAKHEMDTMREERESYSWTQYDEAELKEDDHVYSE